MLDPVGGRHARAGEAVGPGLPWAVLARWPLACGGFDAGHPAGTTGLGLSFQNFNPPLQLGDDRLLLGDDRQQDFPERRSDPHWYPHNLFNIIDRSASNTFPATLGQFNSPTLNCYRHIHSLKKTDIMIH